MASTRTAREQDRVAVAALVLGGIARNADNDQLLGQLRHFDDYAFPFPGDVLTEMAAAALAVAGASCATPVSLIDAAERHLPERTISGNTARQKHRAAIQAAVAMHAGVVVDYDEIAGWRQVQDFTVRAFEAFVVLVRVAVEESDQSLEAVCSQVAGRLGAHVDASRTVRGGT
jgi:hypothetical protein